MWLRNLSLTHLRTFSDVRLELRPGVSVFLGENAQGKTNLLEAVYLLAVARAARAEHDGELIAWGAPDVPPFARIAAEVARGRGDVRLDALVVAYEGAAHGPAQVPRASKRLRVNSVARRASDFVGQLTATLFSVDDLALVGGPPSGRRRYLDLTLSQADHAYARALSTYGRVLQQRNSLLKRIGEGQARAGELEFWDERLVEHGSVVMAARVSAMAPLAREARAAHAILTEEREELTLTYLPKMPGAEGGLPQAAEELAPVFGAALRAVSRREVGAGMTLVGPHRDDLLFAIDGAAASAFGSRAQQRTAALALRLAEARYLRSRAGDDPVLLLDDVLSELDARRRAKVLEAACEFEQALVTSTDADRFADGFLRGRAVFRVGGGDIRPEAAP